MNLTIIFSSTQNIQKIVYANMEDKIFGQDIIVLKNQLTALYMNLWSWFVAFLASFGLTFLQTVHTMPPAGSNVAISILGPGGMDKLKVEDISDSRVTVGCNMKDLGFNPPYYNIDRTKSYDEQFNATVVP